MREQPPLQLIELLQRLGLAKAGQVRRLRRRVRRLASDLPMFESVWIDALVQARILTRFQAAEINAGRGETLRLGPFIILRRLQWPQYADAFEARHADSGRRFHLVVARPRNEYRGELLGRLQSLVAASKNLRSPYISPVTDVGLDGDRLWAAGPWATGISAAQWMAHNGRLHAGAVMHIAQSMLAALAELERADICHGDLSAAGVMFSDAGRVVLPLPGLRANLRPEEGYAHDDLQPAAYDYLAPERVTDGAEPTAASDLYACGCVWWHMLAGRTPLSGGNARAKLRSAQDANIVDIGRWVPERPDELAAAIADCLQPAAEKRPGSMAQLAEALGPPSRAGQSELARCLANPDRFSTPRQTPIRMRTFSLKPAIRWASAVGFAAIVAAILWPVISTRIPLPTASIASGESQTQQALKPKIRQPEPIEQDEPAAPKQLVLSSGKPLVVESLDVKPGQTICGHGGERPMLMVPREGLVVDVDSVKFENVDFVWDHDASAEMIVPGAMVDVRASQIEFNGCSFRSARRSSRPPVAVRWNHAKADADSILALPSGRLAMKNCLLQMVSAGVDCRRSGAIAFVADNTLQVGGGPMLRLDHCPRADEPITMTLSNVTLRESGPLLHCRYERLEELTGEIAIRASRCAFLPGPAQPLLLFDGPTAADGLLKGLIWTGEGSLLSPETPVAAWQTPEGKQTPMDDAAIPMAGLVRSRVTFASSIDFGPSASQLLDWQAPLRSPAPPGADPSKPGFPKK